MECMYIAATACYMQSCLSTAAAQAHYCWLAVQALSLYVTTTSAALTVKFTYLKILKVKLLPGVLSSVNEII
jgi:hypothetical protein